MNWQGNEWLVNEIEQIRFTPVRLREGYEMREVDQFLDHLGALLRAGDSVAGAIARVEFTQIRIREGYNIDEVDAFLRHIASSASRHDTAPEYSTDDASIPAPPAAKSSTDAHPTWQNPITEVRSPLARLFGKRSQR